MNKQDRLISMIVIFTAITLLVLGAAALVVNKNGSVLSSTALPAKSNTSSTSTSTSKTATKAQSYKDGSYTATGSFDTPNGHNALHLSVTIVNGVLTDTSADAESLNRDSVNYDNRFINGYKAQVVGKKINSIKLSYVSGSSLTPIGFNNALQQIKNQAKV